MRFSTFLKSLLLPLLGLAASADPTPVPIFVGIPTGTAKDHVAATIPVGKALLLPISVYDDGGSHPTIKVTSSNKNIFAYVRTGNPVMIMHVKHAASPTYEGDLVFQLFNDWSPVAARYIGGFAQSGYYNNLIFHRLADLNGTGKPDIFQGGDPKFGSIDPTAVHGPGFQYDNELSAPLLFVGRGQLALANSDAGPSPTGTNGSQFFITDDRIRALDFRFTILGQLTHGWDLLDDLRGTPVSSEVPVTPVTIVSTSVASHYTGAEGNLGTHTYNDAMLVLSANRPGTAVITVTAGATITTFTATARKDTVNSPPFFQTRDEVMTKLEKVGVPFKPIDLEYDYLNLTGRFTDNYGSTTTQTTAAQKGGYLTATTSGTFPNSFSDSVGFATTVFVGAGASRNGGALAVTGNPRYAASGSGTGRPYAGPLEPVLSVSQWHPGYRSGYDATPPTTDAVYGPKVTVGMTPVTITPVVVTGAPGTALTDVVAARFTNPDSQARPSQYTATINWGDGTHVATAGAVAFSAAPGAFHGLTVSGTNTYTNPGIYPLVVTLTDNTTGWIKQIPSTAVISSKSLVPSPETVVIRGAIARQARMATFTDLDQPAAASAYSATIDWGDGEVTAGTVLAIGAGHYGVYGTHGYHVPETFSTLVRIHKAGQNPGADAVVWSRLHLSGFVAQQHLPPFDQAHVTGEIGLAPSDLKNTQGGPTLPVKVTAGSQTYSNLQITLINAGNLTSKPSVLRFYLARGTTIQRTPILDAQGHVTTPADTLLAFGPDLAFTNNGVTTEKVQTSVTIPALGPGNGLRYYFKQNAFGDYRLRFPAGETGTGYNLIADIENSDPLLGTEPIAPPTYGRLQGIMVSSGFVTTSETGTQATFTVAVDRQPTANVTIPLSGDATEDNIPASVVITPQNWKSPQTVTITGLSDSALPPNNTGNDHSNVSYRLSLGAAQSTDLLYNGLIGPSVVVTNDDRDGDIGVAASATSTTTAAGSPSTAPTLATSAAPNTTNHVGTITLTMTKKPTADVTVQVFVQNTSDGVLVSDGTFGPSNPNLIFQVSDFTSGTTTLPSVSKTFHLQGVRDTGNTATSVSYLVYFQATSTDPTYSGITPVPVMVTNQNQ